MKAFISRLLSPVVAASALVFTGFAQAEYDTVFLDLASGGEMSHFRIGLGETPMGSDGDKVTSMFYAGYFLSDDLVKFEDISLGKQEVEIATLGVGGFGYLENHEEQGGAEFDFELSQTSADALDYERLAIGMRAQLFLPIAAGLQANVGVNLRPFFLAEDWDDSANLEYEYQAGLEYAFNWDVAIYAHYRFLGAYLKNDDKITLAEGSLFGLRARF